LHGVTVNAETRQAPSSLTAVPSMHQRHRLAKLPLTPCLGAELDSLVCPAPSPLAHLTAHTGQMLLPMRIEKKPAPSRVSSSSASSVTASRPSRHRGCCRSRCRRRVGGARPPPSDWPPLERATHLGEHAAPVSRLGLAKLAETWVRRAIRPIEPIEQPAPARVVAVQEPHGLAQCAGEMADGAVDSYDQVERLDQRGGGSEGKYRFCPARASISTRRRSPVG
jgi:hypothetical protein